jgi:rRNA maturation protein Nop10
MTLQAKCTQCGGATRLVGIEPHHKFGGVDIWTLECMSCGHTDVEMPQHGAAPAMAEGSQPLN